VFCLIAPYVNSYRRFIAAHSAAVNLEWGEDNRTTGLRIPLSPPEACRVENSIIDMDCMGSIPTNRFPGGSLARTPLLVLAMLYYTLRDRF